LAMGLLPFDDRESVQGERDERLRYLQKLMKQAKQTRDLKEYYGLLKHELSGAVLSDAQRKRYQVLTQELSDYIDVIKDIVD
ncbi:MAG: hypothetical protein VKL39_03415, partial [Leptolyngbyaceae bacterium]|nr:hypothetical protein [Leptolyngbyaceae bacterium]